MPTKKCKICGSMKSTSKFYRHIPTGRTTVYLDTMCKECKKLDSRIRYSPSKRLKNRYGMTLKQLQQLGTQCHICGTTEKLCTDHDHKTGRIRGRLCSRCNTGLGLFLDSSENLHKAITYLECNKLVHQFITATTVNGKTTYKEGIV